MPITLDTVAVGGLINVPISRQLQTGSSVGVAWSITAGTLPSGLSLNASTGVISGVATALFENYVTIRVENAFAESHSRAVLVKITDFATVPLDQTGSASSNRPSSSLFWDLGGTLWQAATQRLASPTRWVLGFYKSTDNGVSWFQKGFSDPDFPSTTVSSEQSHFVVTYSASDNLFYVAYPDAGSLRIATFSPVTANWVLKSSSGGPATVIRGYFALRCSNGTLHVYYRKNGASASDGQLYVSTWTEAGGWLVVDKLISDTSAHPSGDISNVANECNTQQLFGIGAVEADGVVQVFYIEDLTYFVSPTYQRKLHWRQLSLDAATLGGDYVQPDTDPTRTDNPFIQGNSNLQSFIKIGRRIYSFFKRHEASVGGSLRPAYFIADLDTLQITYADIFTTAQNQTDEGIFFVDPSLPNRLYAMYVQYSNFFGDVLFLQYNDLAGGGWVPAQHVHAEDAGFFTPTKEVVHFGWAFGWPGELLDGVNGNDPCDSAPIIYNPRPVVLGDGRIVVAANTETDLGAFDRIVIASCEGAGADGGDGEPVEGAYYRAS